MTKILIVEDEAISSLFLEEYLEKLGYTILETVDNGNDAYTLAEKYLPDLIIMDINIKGKINGIETAEKIYSSFGIPIIYLTAYSDKDTVEKAIKSGSFAYLLKPIDEKYLEPTIKIVLEKYRNEEKLKFETKLLNNVINKMDTALIFTDIKGNIKFINDEIKSILNEKINITNITDLFFEAKNYIYELQNLEENTICKKIYFDKKILHINISKVEDEKNRLYGFIFNFGHNIKNKGSQLSICSFCKKIKDNSGKWFDIEKYVQENFNIAFSHGICIDCTNKYYSDVIKD
ncbi:MAG: hypothetical protein KatS3mg068_1319 [Candidatus Sericytochromatia bacterium]|nr:MAG: hypothetical protein KatS3mg068_1319 [Candidatus Sericytochromatia bacterium]